MKNTVKIEKGTRLVLRGEYTEILCEAIFALTGVKPEIDGGEALCDGEELTISVGLDSCGCAANEGARAAIAAMEKTAYFDARYAIYCKDNRVAILYDRNEYTDIQAGEAAVDTFIKKFLLGKDEVVFEEGLILSGYYDLIEMQKARDGKRREADWEKFRAEAIEKYGKEFGDDLADAFVDFYALFRPSMVEWYAHLYEPSIGGLYASLSGKEHFGFLPLLESTVQAMRHMESFGVFPHSWPASIPKQMRYRISYFMKSCQDPNGYFYHPQMIKAVTDSALNSRGRNLGRGVSGLAELGMKPTYPTPRDDPYDGVTADEWWDSMVAAGEIPADEERPFVPKSLLDYRLWLEGKPTFKTKDEAMEQEHYEVPKQSAVAASTSSGEYLKSHKGFSDYLDSKPIDKYPYSCASELNGTYALIKASSDKLGRCTEEGAWYSGMTLCEMTIDWLNRHINSKGLFGEVLDEESDPDAGCKYANTNGLMKAMPIYNDWGVAYPEPLLAARGCLRGIMSSELSYKNICETYNIWEAFKGVITNVKAFAPEKTREATLKEINEALGKFGPEAIRNCYRKQKRYQKDSGAFSHNIYKSECWYMGGVHCGLEMNDANVDANGFGSASIIRAMLGVFELSHVMPPMFYTWNYMKYLDIVLSAKPHVKKEVPENLLWE